MSAAVSASICLVRAPAFCTFMFYTVTASTDLAIMTSRNYTLLCSDGTSRTTGLFIARRAVSGATDGGIALLSMGSTIAIIHAIVLAPAVFTLMCIAIGTPSTGRFATA